VGVGRSIGSGDLSGCWNFVISPTEKKARKRKYVVAYATSDLCPTSTLHIETR